MEMVYGGEKVAGSWSCAGLCFSSPRLWTLRLEWKQMPFLWANSSPMPTVTLCSDQVLYLRLWSDNEWEDCRRGVFVYLFIYLFIYVIFMNVYDHLSFLFFFFQRKNSRFGTWVVAMQMCAYAMLWTFELWLVNKIKHVSNEMQASGVYDL